MLIENVVGSNVELNEHQRRKLEEYERKAARKKELDRAYQKRCFILVVKLFVLGFVV